MLVAMHEKGYIQKSGFLRHISILVGQRSFTRILYAYRYMSWLFTSLYYLIGNPMEPFVFKVGVVISLFIAGKILTDIYVRFQESRTALELTVLIETIGIAFLLIPTGGMESPFLWYAMNPVLVAASFLPLYFCWINLGFYVICGVVISYAFFRYSTYIGTLFSENAYMILAFVLITLMVQLLSRLTKRLSQHTLELEKKSQQLQKMNEELQYANGLYQESMEHIMSMYQALEVFSSQDSPDSLANAFAEHSARLTRSEGAFFWMAPYMGVDSFISVYGEEVLSVRDQLIKKMENSSDNFRDAESLIELNVGTMNFAAVIVKSASRYYGILGIKIDGRNGSVYRYKKQMNFLAELCAITLERYELEEVADQFLIVEEQNRIANEIHDSVSQRLFSIVCGILVLISKGNHQFDQEIMEQLGAIRDSANQAIQELRSSIYRLSSRKKGEMFFSKTLRSYMESFGTLNHVDFKLDIRGDENILSGSLRKALYRIICEATGNAVRHGKCSRLIIDIDIGSVSTIVFIRDNGRGFDIERVSENKRRGLGLYNIKSLVQSFNGSVDIQSRVGAGTEIKMVIPHHKEIFTDGEVAL